MILYDKNSYAFINRLNEDKKELNTMNRLIKKFNSKGGKNSGVKE